jgi:hypothetical protein
MKPYTIPSEQEFFAESLHFLDICQSQCACHDHWHFFWASLKATGLRRGVYHQYDLFKSLLDDHLSNGSKVFIAGAADAGSLQVLHAVAGDKQVEFTVMDHCQAPLTMVAEYAQRHGIRVETQLGDISQLTSDALLDTILIHNTLILMSKSARVDALMAFVRRLAPQGIILCNVRYLMRIDGKDHSLALDEADAIEKKIKTTFAAYPGVVDLIEPMIMPFVLAQNASLSTRPYKAELIAELDLAGLEIIAAYPEDAAMPQMVSQGNAALKLNAEMLLLRCKAKA